MAFAHENLAEGETILHVGRFHPILWQARWVVYILYGILALFCGFGLSWGMLNNSDATLVVSFWCLVILPPTAFLYRCAQYNRVYKTEFVLTNKRLLTKKGFLRTVVREIQLQKIESVDYGQIFLERWLNVGRLTVRGTGGGKVGTYSFLVDAMDFRKQIVDQIDKVSG